MEKESPKIPFGLRWMQLDNAILKLFSWGGFGVGHGVVYDDSDQVLLPSDRQSDEWKQRAKGSELDCGVWGKPVGVGVAKDGSLLVSDDGSGSIWRVTYERK